MATFGILVGGGPAPGINGVIGALLPLLLLLGRSRSDPRGPLGVRMVGIVGGILMFVGFVIFLNYPLRHRPRAGEGHGGHPTASDS